MRFAIVFALIAVSYGVWPILCMGLHITRWNRVMTIREWDRATDTAEAVIDRVLSRSRAARAIRALDLGRRQNDSVLSWLAFVLAWPVYLDVVLNAYDRACWRYVRRRGGGR